MELVVTLYTRKDCKLCDQAKTDLDALNSTIPHKLVVVDIDQDPDLVALYGHKVPVVTAGPFTLAAPFDRRDLRKTLGAAQDSHEMRMDLQGEVYTKKLNRRQEMTGGDRLSHFISGRYMLVVNLVLAIYLGLPFLAPVLMQAGYPKAAAPIYTVYKAVCHELAFRSWFLFGEQTYYPREAAGIEGVATYGEVTGNSEENLMEARNFTGNPQMGYKIALCQRDILIYAAMLLFGIIFSLSGRRIKPLPFLIWVIVGIIPVALDGGSQLLSQWLPWFPYRESTPLLRSITGALFGFTTGWFGFPALEESMRDTRQYLAAKRARVESGPAAE